MKTTNFAEYITDFISKYLSGIKGASMNTISSYVHTFKLLIQFMDSENGIRVEKLRLEMITKSSILDFLEWLEINRGNTISTRNQRLAAIHSFYRYIQTKRLDNLFESQEILSIPFKKNETKTPVYLTTEGVKLLLSQIDIKTKKGRRDLAMLSIMYDTATRVQELIDLTPSSLRLEGQPIVKVIGKGNKARLIPILNDQTEIIKNYLIEFGMNLIDRKFHPLFYNSRNQKLTRAGVNYILRKYAVKARKIDSTLVPEKISCHCLRHSKAMHLLQAGVNLVYIRDILGHKSVETTEIYARTDSKFKREAIEKAYVDINPDEKPSWEGNKNLLDWLNQF